MSSVWTIRRSATDAKLAGLCGGVAQHWGVDPLLVRVGWVLLALSGGVGLVLYLAGWLLIPVEGKDKALVEDLFGESVRRWPRELWITFVVIASLAMTMVFGWLSPFTIGPAVVIAVIWYFGFYKGRHDKRSETPLTPAADSLPASPQPDIPQFVQYSGPPTPFTQAAEAWQRRIEEHTHQVGAAAATSPAASTTAPTAAEPAAQWPSPPQANLSDPSAESQAPEHTAFLAEPDPVGLYVESSRPAPIKPYDTRSAKRLRLVSLIMLGLTLSGLGVAQALGVTYSAGRLCGGSPADHRTDAGRSHLARPGTRSATPRSDTRDLRSAPHSSRTSISGTRRCQLKPHLRQPGRAATRR